jgi:hypothetical protein
MSSPPEDTSQDRARGLAAPVAPSVHDDLAAIFPAEPARDAPAARPRRERTSLPKAGGRRSAEGLAGLGAIVAAAAVGLAGGLLMAERPAKPPPIRLPAAPAAAAALSALPPLGGIDPGRGAALERAATPPSPAAAGLPQPLKVADPRTAAPRARPTAIRTVDRQGCGADRRCSHADLLAADARLRRAYHAATRAGVPNPVLADYRDRWARLRRRSTDEPARVVAGYGQMARELGRMAAAPVRARYRPRHEGPMERLGEQIASVLR